MADWVLRIGGDGAAHLLEREVVLLLLDVLMSLAQAAHGLRRHDLVPDRLLARLRFSRVGGQGQNGSGEPYGRGKKKDLMKTRQDGA